MWRFISVIYSSGAAWSKLSAYAENWHLRRLDSRQETHGSRGAMRPVPPQRWWPVFLPTTPTTRSREKPPRSCRRSRLTWRAVLHSFPWAAGMFERPEVCEIRSQEPPGVCGSRCQEPPGVWGSRCPEPPGAWGSWCHCAECWSLVRSESCYRLDRVVWRCALCSTAKVVLYTPRAGTQTQGGSDRHRIASLDTA